MFVLLSWPRIGRKNESFILEQINKGPSKDSEEDKPSLPVIQIKNEIF